MDTNKRTARIAGLLYFTVVLSGLFSLMYVPSQLNVKGDAGATLAKIQAGETLFRLGILASIICYTAFLFLPVVLYKLLSSVDRAHAFVMTALAVVSVPIAYINLLNKFAVLSLISRTEMPAAEMQSAVMHYLEMYSSGVHLTTLFWGLWLMPFGYLVFRSGILPRVLGVLLVLGCCGYVTIFFGDLLSPGFSDQDYVGLVTIPAALGEIGICFWLLIVGAQENAQTA